MQRLQRERIKTFKALQSAANALSVSQIVDQKVAKERKLYVLQPVAAEQPCRARDT
jgi:hypothetical protein